MHVQQWVFECKARLPRDGGVGPICFPLVDSGVLIPVEVSAGEELLSLAPRAPDPKHGAHAVGRPGTGQNVSLKLGNERRYDRVGAPVLSPPLTDQDQGLRTRFGHNVGLQAPAGASKSSHARARGAGTQV